MRYASSAKGVVKRASVETIREASTVVGNVPYIFGDVYKYHQRGMYLEKINQGVSS